MAKNNCEFLQESIGWCEGKFNVPGIRRTIYFTACANVVKAPDLPVDEQGRPTDVTLVGKFELKADAVFHKVEGVPNKNQHTSDPQGDIYSQTQQEKLSFFFPATDADGTKLELNFNNVQNFVIFQDAMGNWRCLRNAFGTQISKVKQDSGTSITDSVGSTLEIEDVDKVSAPFLPKGIVIPTDDGDITLGEAPAVPGN